jgi:hypothetical protein
MRLVLPLPDSLNRWPKSAMAEHAAKRRYQREVWVKACAQHKPTHEPPAHVVIRASFYLRNKRDEDNLKGSLKWVLDALKQRQTGKLDWRMGIADEKGFFIDDDPARLTVAEPEQVIDRKEPRLILEIEEAA